MVILGVFGVMSSRVQVIRHQLHNVTIIARNNKTTVGNDIHVYGYAETRDVDFGVAPS